MPVINETVGRGSRALLGGRAAKQAHLTAMMTLWTKTATIFQTTKNGGGVLME